MKLVHRFQRNVSCLNLRKYCHVSSVYITIRQCVWPNPMCYFCWRYLETVTVLILEKNLRAPLRTTHPFIPQLWCSFGAASVFELRFNFWEYANRGHKNLYTNIFKSIFLKRSDIFLHCNTSAVIEEINCN